ncbi:NAD(P)/FAD-dependent oxidoreductase [Nocardioides sp. Root151]|uniref:NAD(P)/FAD-dependent oxidoreductase n=1 Tax=Nocardioides sp. Root151 TaxID=1736475 RepID=UPI0007033BF2|nr:FAD-dependent oxidoreductase [Nocardioides sp. Root151]KQZ75672.1 p-cumate dioxygenase [Nocardioides sp. Root151]
MSSPDPTLDTANDTRKVLVVGASVAGVRTVQALRSAGFTGVITVLGAERHFPYDKPPISKEMLSSEGTGEPVPLLTEDDVAKLDVELRLGAAAVRLDPAAKVVTTEDGAEHAYDVLVIATGASARNLPSGEGLAGVHTLRNAEDAVQLRSELAPGRKAVVVGAGFIGAEFAAAARAWDVDVTVVEAQPIPLAHILGDRIGAELGGLHELHGATLLTGVTTKRLVGETRVEAVELSDGRTLPADIVVVGIGAEPATAWLKGSGLPVSNGIDCEASLEVTGFPDVYAAGDVARPLHFLYGEPVRIEHWTNANDHAALVASSILGTPVPRPALPYVWSDQYGHRIQIIGLPSRGELVLTRGSAATGDLVAAYAGPDGVLVGALVLGNPRMLMKCRKAVMKSVHHAEFERDLPAAS